MAVNQITETILTGMSEPGFATPEISERAASVSSSTDTVTTNISDVSQVIAKTAESVNSVQTVSREAHEEIARLRGAVDQFLSEVRAA